jgi:NitT/TauT family transport system permease protein
MSETITVDDPNAGAPGTSGPTPASAAAGGPEPGAAPVAPAPPARRARRGDGGSRLGSIARVGLPPVGVFAVVIGLWYCVTELALNKQQRFMLPAPDKVLTVGFLDSKNFSSMMSALKLTVEASVYGLIISIIIGVAAAIVMSQAKWLERSFYPWVVVVQVVPILALTPMLSFFFGFSLTSRVIVCVIISFAPIVFNTLMGLQSAAVGEHDLFTLHHAGRLTRLWKLQLPAALPAMFTGFRIAAGLSVIGAIVGETFFKQGEPGLGTNMSVFTSLLEGERLWATVITASVLGIVIFIFFTWLGQRVVGRWDQPDKG